MWPAHCFMGESCEGGQSTSDCGRVMADIPPSVELRTFMCLPHSLHLSDSEWRGQESGTASRYSLSPVRPAHCCCFQSFEWYPFPSDFQTSVLLRQRGDCFISNVRSEPGWLSPLGSSASLGFRVAVHNWHCCVVFFLFLTVV